MLEPGSLVTGANMTEKSGQSKTISTAYARSLFDYLRALGLDPTAVLPAEKVGDIEAGEMHGQTDLSGWLKLFGQAANQVADPDMGLKLGESLQIRHLGIAGYVLMSCGTLREAEEQMGRFMKLVGELGRAYTRRHGDSAELGMDWGGVGKMPPPMAQIFAASSAQMSRWLTGRSDLVFDAHFCFSKPADTSYYERIFGRTPRFGLTHTKLVFPAAYFELPITMGNPELREMVEAQAEAVLKTLVGEPEILRRSKIAITQNLSTGRASLANIARVLGISTRTLHRRLEECGCTFRDLVEAVRQSRAETFLRSRDISLAEIAFMLGYSEQSTFHNAFKRWTGITPNEFRAAAA